MTSFRLYKKIILLFSFLILFVLFFVLTSPHKDYNLSEYCPLNLGSNWTYIVMSDGKNSKINVSIESKEIINGIETFRVLYPDMKYDYVTFDAEGVKVYKEEFFSEGIDKIYNIPKIILPNINIGENRSYLLKVKIRNIIDGSDIMDVIINFYVSAEGMDTVEVPVGKFNRCLRFSSSLKWKSSDGEYGDKIYTFWLAKGVGLIKCIYKTRKFGNKGEMKYSRNKDILLIKYQCK